MGKIILLDEIADKVLRNPNKNFSLFGRKDFVQTEKDNYNLIFHYISGIPLEQLKEDPSYVVPFLSEKYSSLREQMQEMYQIYTIAPNITTFTVKDQSPKIKSSKEKHKIVSGLKFFNIQEIGIGKEIISNPNYLSLNETDLKNNFQNWEEILKIRKQIDTRYSNY